jgi:intracellular sulfur oxidation DsrE/DsrF family protein
VTYPKQPNSDRREFLAHVATAAAVIATSACAVPLAAASAQPSPVTAGTRSAPPYDDEWTRRVAAARHRAVFDSPGVDDGLALEHATFFMLGYKEQLGVSGSDVVPVVVLRHAGTVMAMNDLLWERFALGERSKTKDPLTEKDAIRNPFARVGKEEKNPIVSPAATLESLLASGAIVLACNKAAMRIANQMAAKLNRDVEEVRAEVRNNLVPGVLLQPSGIYAVLRAQDVGCAFIKST